MQKQITLYIHILFTCLYYFGSNLDEEFENVPPSRKAESSRQSEENVKKVVMASDAEEADDDDAMIEVKYISVLTIINYTIL